MVRRNDTKLTHIYETAVAATETQERLLNRFIDKAFSGSASELVLRALSVKPVSAEERSAIRALLTETERNRQ